MTKEKILAKIKRLLELSNTSKNDSEEEAKAAMLKAQELMAKYEVSIEEVSTEEEQQFAHEECEHKWDYGYRIPLGVALANNFRCKVYLSGKSVVFMGHSIDAKICKETFEFAYKFIMKKGNQIYNKKYAMGHVTKGVFNSYALGFIRGLKEALEVQSRALIIVTPPDVEQEFDVFTKNCKTHKGSTNTSRLDFDTYNQGVKDGRQFANRDKLPQ